MTPTIPDIEEADEGCGRKRAREGGHADARTSLAESCGHGPAGATLVDDDRDDHDDHDDREMIIMMMTMMMMTMTMMTMTMMMNM
jgi:hypothetical protein